MTHAPPPSAQQQRLQQRQAWIGIGANLGDAAATVKDAIHAIDQLPACRLQAQSSLYRSAPVDAGGDDYVNAVARIVTTLAPDDLLAALLRLEQRWGRERPYRNAPRTLDLDLLMLDDLQYRSDTLSLPHPRMHLRAFVLAPLTEIDPVIEIPGRGKAASLLAGLTGQRIQRMD